MTPRQLESVAQPRVLKVVNLYFSTQAEYDVKELTRDIGCCYLEYLRLEYLRSTGDASTRMSTPVMSLFDNGQPMRGHRFALRQYSGLQIHDQNLFVLYVNEASGSCDPRYATNFRVEVEEADVNLLKKSIEDVITQGWP